MRSELAIETFLASVADHQHDRFDLFPAADQIRGVAHAHVREMPVHGMSHFLAEDVRHVRAFAADGTSELIDGQSFRVPFFHETNHQTDSDRHERPGAGAARADASSFHERVMAGTNSAKCSVDARGRTPTMQPVFPSHTSRSRSICRVPSNPRRFDQPIACPAGNFLAGSAALPDVQKY
jgi:hypothetical protein